ncbi:T9SS type A sorting domain-containing protein [Flavobacterium sp.]|uniref:type IX secretion system anionic LPS delivery protein PorZ n=1 Tax=Flavobacterium sp. TaxID=239 RepID=UPI0038FBE71B
MKKNVLFILFLIVVQISFAQNNLLWKGYFSYNEIKDISESTTAVFAASENALFSQNTSIIKTTNTIDGLSGQTIAALYYSPTFKKTLVGYEDGLIVIINDADNSMLNVVDIVKKQIPSNIKKINHFIEYNGIVYISCDFGVVQFNLSTLQFGDTYFIGPSGEETRVYQTTIYNNEIYAVTQYYGIRKGNLSNPNLNDFKQWQVFDARYWNGIVNFNNQLVAYNSNNKIYMYNGARASFDEIFDIGQGKMHFKATTNYLIATTASSVYVFDKQLELIRQINSSQITPSIPSFTCATVVDDKIYMGTKEDGMMSTLITPNSLFDNNTPSGPTRNNIFALDVTPNTLWAVYGGYSGNYNPYAFNNDGFPNSYGISKYTSKGWLHIPYEKVLGAKAISRIIINPKNEKQVYASSFFSGLLKIENDEPNFLYNENNSSLEEITFIPGYRNDVRINGTAFDKSGNLWVNNSLVDKGLSVLKINGQWQSYSLGTILKDSKDANLSRMIIDKNGTKWFGANTNGLISFNESNNKFKKISIGSTEGNLPINDVRVIALDTRNQLWIGTTKGLRVLSNVSSFLTEDQMTTNPIIILEDNLAQELFYEQFITDIVVDGANNKWVGTADSGVFQVSSNGQETKYHFTKDNSPLPSNTINDIAINSDTGEVFIATDKGMVSFKGTSTVANENLESVYVYPNPVRPEFQGNVKITGLLDKANVKITDIQGNLVHETTSEGGTIEWDTTAFGKHKVASGVYMIFVAAQDGIETKVKKVMIIR